MRSVKRAAALGAAIAVGLLTVPAFAQVVASDVVLHGPDSEWDVANGESFHQSDGAGFGQCLIHGRAFTPVFDGSYNGAGPSQTDAFDGGMGMRIGDKTFLDGNNAGVKTGQQLAVGPETMSHLKVSEKVRALPDRDVLRVLATYKNPTNSPITKVVAYDSSMGSDSLTMIFGTSNGDENFTTNDRWLATGLDPTIKTKQQDPAVVQVLYGPKQPREKVIDVLFDPEADNGDAVGEYCVTVRYKITIPAGKARSMLWFSKFSVDGPTAINGGNTFNTNRAAFFVGMTTKEKNRVLNWDLKN